MHLAQMILFNLSSLQKWSDRITAITQGTTLVPCKIFTDAMDVLLQAAQYQARATVMEFAFLAHGVFHLLEDNCLEGVPAVGD